MADSNFRGPLVSIGALEDVNATTTSGVSVPIQPLDGPSAFYQGQGWLDPRSIPYNKDNYRPGQVPVFLSISDCFAVDNQPQATSTTLLAASQVATAAVAVALATTQVSGPGAGIPSVAVGVPILPQGTTVATTATIALDFGFATGTTVAASSTVVVNDSTQFTVGQWVVIGGVANVAGQSSLVTQVQSITAGTTTIITVSPSPATAFSHAPIGAANLFGGQFLPPATQFVAAATPNATAPNTVAGLVRVHNPREFVARNILVSAGTTSATTTIEIFGWDVWRQPMTESITVPSGNRSASSFFGQKAFKFISNMTVSTTAGGNITVGVGDVFGCPIRADEWEQTQIFWNGCTVPTSLGFLKAVTTAPATNTTGDVRGTIQVSTQGGGSAASVATASLSNNSARLVIIQNTGQWNTITATPNNTVPLFGVANSTT